MFNDLTLTIDHSSKTATFSGKGTFRAKDTIKSLGKYRFDTLNKTWVINSFEFSLEEILEKFPGIEVSELGKAETNRANVVTTIESSVNKEDVPGALSVSEFIQRAQIALKREFPTTFCIYGVLTEVNFSKQRLFMDLAEQEQRDTRVKCVIWNSIDQICAALVENGFKLEADLPVMFEVMPNISAKGAQISLTVKRIIVEYTKSKLASLREQTNERLRKEGLFLKNKETILSFLPKRLGILTSAGGTVINDFLASLAEANFGFELFWLNVNVQGVEARNSVLSGIRKLAERKDLDAILIFRGGGSQAELSVFNDYEIAKAVCLCPLPVISAIGHQEDQCSVQDVSFKACGVPKEIGWFFAKIIIDYKKSFSDFLKNIHNLSQIAYQKIEQRFFDLLSPLFSMAKKSFQLQIANFQTLRTNLPQQILRVFSVKENNLSSLAKSNLFQAEKIYLKHESNLSRNSSLLREVKFLLENKEQRLIALEEIIQGASPEVQMKRGFAIVKTKDGSGYIKSAKETKPGEEINIEFIDKAVIAKVQ